VVPVLLLTTSSFGLNVSIVLVATLFRTSTSSALPMVNDIVFPLIAHVPRIVPVTPWLRVLLMNPERRSWDTYRPSASNDIVSFLSPTLACQSPTIFAEYSASPMGATSGEHDKSPQANSTPNKNKRGMIVFKSQFPNLLGKSITSFPETSRGLLAGATAGLGIL
jgi:hypothetical protein